LLVKLDLIFSLMIGVNELMDAKLAFFVEPGDG
jgi:hypothetical protein